MARITWTRGAAAGVAVVLALTVAACGKSDESTASTTTSKPTTTADAASTTTSGSSSATVWQQDAQQFRGQDGTTHQLDCTPGGTADTVWGAGTYTDDSSICTAAVQSGLVTFAKGGEVAYEIGPGQDSYDGGVANGVTSQPYGSWEGSFTFPDAPPGTVEIAAGPESWTRNLADRQDPDGTRVTVVCSPNGTAGSVWGSGPYTNDSSACTAAVHAGLMTLAEGGTVVAQVAPGQSSYKGSTANGITSSDYGSFGRSFTFPSDQSTG